MSDDFIVGKTVASVSEQQRTQSGWPQIVIEFTDGTNIAVCGTSDNAGDVDLGFMDAEVIE